MSNEIYVLFISTGLALFSSIVLAIISKIVQKKDALSRLLEEIKELKEMAKETYVSTNLKNKLTEVIKIKEGQVIFMKDLQMSRKFSSAILFKLAYFLIWGSLILFLNGPTFVHPDNLILLFLVGQVFPISIIPFSLLMLYGFFFILYPMFFEVTYIVQGNSNLLRGNHVTQRLEVDSSLGSGMGKRLMVIVLSTLGMIFLTTAAFNIAISIYMSLQGTYIISSKTLPASDLLYSLIFIVNVLLAIAIFYILLKKATWSLKSKEYKIDFLEN